MWLLPVEGLCRQHLLGEHFECHCLAHVYDREGPESVKLTDLARYGVIEMRQLKSRHNALANELERRGYNHDWGNNPFRVGDYPDLGRVDLMYSYRTLVDRCRACATRMAVHIDYETAGIKLVSTVQDEVYRSTDQEVDEPVRAPKTGWQPH